MIDVKIDCNAGVDVIRFGGSVADVCAEIGYLIGYVYCGCLEQDPQLADMIRTFMVDLVSDDSPVWIPDAEFEPVAEESGKAGAT